MKEDDETILEIGIGDTRQFAKSIGLDIRKTPEIDIIADARRLPFTDGSFDRVYSSHTLEHFSHQEVREVLAEWIRTLKEGGILEIRCPDLRARALLFAIRPNWNDIKNIYGEQDYPENYHKSGYSFKMLKNILKDLGISDCKRIIHGYKGIPFMPDCLHVKGIKINKNKRNNSKEFS